MKIFDLQKGKQPDRSLTLLTPWFQFILSFGKKFEQPVDEKNEFDLKMDEIREGRRLHPVMMTVKERHEETAREARKIKWSDKFYNSWETVTAFEAIRSHARPQGKAFGFMSLFTLEERQELRKIIREEIKEEMASQQQKI